MKPPTRFTPFSAIAKVALLARTARHLRASQIAALLYRRVVPASRPHRQRDRIRVRPRRSMEAAIGATGEDARRDMLRFVGLEKSIEPGIDWRSPEMSRLWRYNLHYFDYLRDEFRTADWKESAIDDWIASNPRGTRDAWEPYPVSLRIVNWIKYFDRLEREKRVAQPSWLESLYRQALWLETNLERHVLANHYLKNATALLFTGLFFEGIDADRWRARGERILRSQVVEQFLDDGGHYERSPMYHIIALEDLLDAINICATHGALARADFLELLRRRARAALDFLESILMPDEQIPLFNDAALGIAPAPAEIFDYAHRLIGYERPSRSAAPFARAFPKTGYYVIRSGGDTLVIDCGDMGPPYQPGHGHCDMLSYELALGGERFVVDTGVYDYEGGARRLHARGTAAHNTVSLDGGEQSEIWGAFRVGRRARPLRAALRIDSEGEILFEGALEGFRDRIVHRRALSRSGGRWSVNDTVEGRGTHLLESRVHLAPNLQATLLPGRIEVNDGSGESRATIVYDSSTGLRARTETGNYHPRFGTSLECSVVVFFITTELPARFGYSILEANLSSGIESATEFA